jgi:carboxyl-terminal processing protease
MRKTSSIFMGAIVGVGLTLVATHPRTVLSGWSATAASSAAYQQLNLFGDVYERVRADYVEKPDDSKLVASAINGMLTGLDPHSSYMDPGSLRDLQVQTRGEFGGLGIEVTMEDDLVKVVAPIDETPAAKAGVMANDLIIKLDNEQVHGLTLNQAVEKMRGPVNTKIKLTVMRKGQDKPIDVTIVREAIRVKSVRSHTEGDDVGYIRVTQFNEQTTEGQARPRTSSTCNSQQENSPRLRRVCAGLFLRAQPLRSYSVADDGLSINQTRSHRQRRNGGRYRWKAIRVRS